MRICGDRAWGYVWIGHEDMCGQGMRICVDRA